MVACLQFLKTGCAVYIVERRRDGPSSERPQRVTGDTLLTGLPEECPESWQRERSQIRNLLIMAVNIVLLTTVYHRSLYEVIVSSKIRSHRGEATRFRQDASVTESEATSRSRMTGTLSNQELHSATKRKRANHCTRAMVQEKLLEPRVLSRTL